uniref:Uncharacterized protein n=1 Tax=Avena sativa TaxID=4498 RepID=A0ACD5WPC2_AVESA
MVNLTVMGAGPVPTADYLDRLARTLSKKPTSRGWDCPLCQHKNNPVDNLLVKLPAFKCSNPDIDCPGKCPATPEWSINECVVNGVRCDFVIRDQGPYPTCTAQALLHGMDAKLKVHGALYGKILLQQLNGSDLLAKYCEKVKSALGEEVDPAVRNARTPCLLQIAQSDGVEYIAPDGSLATGRKLRISSWFYLKTDEINLLIRLIASGFPLLTSMTTGRCFTMTNEGEIYMSPQLTPNHAIVLIGFWVRPIWLPGEDGSTKLVEKVLFKARDSKGDRAHISGQQSGTGGDIYLLAEDLPKYAFGFHLEPPSWMQ